MPTVEVSSPTHRVTDPGSSLVCSHNITKTESNTSIKPKTIWAAKRAAALEDFIPQHEVHVVVVGDSVGSVDILLEGSVNNVHYPTEENACSSRARCPQYLPQTVSFVRWRSLDDRGSIPPDVVGRCLIEPPS